VVKSGKEGTLNKPSSATSETLGSVVNCGNDGTLVELPILSSVLEGVLGISSK